MAENLFEQEYKKLNKAQKEAVDTIEGPVMVVAGPGTGKTQVLSLRIANILTKTDTPADGVLCLTFTNSGVKAMKERLRKYIGAESTKVNIFTFHSFGLKMIEEYHSVLDLDQPPKLLDDKSSIVIFDFLLNSEEWEYLRPRSDGGRYFRDLKSIISLLKREGIKPHEFANEIEKEIEQIKNDPANLSTRGETKGQLKKEFEKKIESLYRTMEVVEFYKKYEKLKKEENWFDYDDVLENLVNIVMYSDDARADIKERFLYVLVDEHQDSSAMQNAFLERVWGKEEKPNIFVVGDDRQLIYGFGGASFEYFEGFQNTFSEAKLITLTENYRSTQKILDVSDALLQSRISKDSLRSNSKAEHPLRLFECDFKRDEIILAGQDIKKHVEAHELDLDNCAILVPKNKHVSSALRILADLGIKASANDAIDVFDVEETESLLRVLRVLADPFDKVSLAQTFFDPQSALPPLVAHKFLRSIDMKNFSLATGEEVQESLFKDSSPEKVWLNKLREWLAFVPENDVYTLVQKIGDELLLKTAQTHELLTRRVEVLRTFLHLVLAEVERNPKITLPEFLASIDRLKEYGAHIPLAVFARNQGVKVMTLHASKGLEFDYVWIAHMDEGSFERGKKSGFTLPEAVAKLVEAKDEETLKRELYVAITRAKLFCTISYARYSYEGRESSLSATVALITDSLFDKIDASESEKLLLHEDVRSYVTKKDQVKEEFDLTELTKLVAKEYDDKLVSVSLLNNFFECPWKWYFRNLLQLPEPISPSLEYGTLVHDTLDKILKLKKTPDATEIENFAGADGAVLKIVEKWVALDLPRVSLNRETEKSISVKDPRFPHLSIYGKIDLIENTAPDECMVTDFKTGSAKKKNEIEKLDDEGRMSNLLRQLAMYSFLLSASPKWQKQVSVSRLLFLEAKNDKERYYDTRIDAEQVDLLVRDIGDYDTWLKEGSWVNRPCNFNAYGKADAVCEYCKLSEIYKK